MVVSMIVTVSRQNDMWKVVPVSGTIGGGSVVVTPAVILRDVELIVSGTPSVPWETKRAYAIGRYVWSKGDKPLEMPAGVRWSFFRCEVGAKHVFTDAFRSTPLRRADKVYLSDGDLQKYTSEDCGAEVS